MTQPIGFFVHHQGRGHATRILAIIRHMPEAQPVTIFTANPALFSCSLPDHITICAIPSLFERTDETPHNTFLHHQPTPDVMHCVPLGWPSITHAIAIITNWCDTVKPRLMVVDVSAEIALLCRIASIPAVKIRQHGDRLDAGHLAAYQSCVGLLAPFHEALEQPNMPEWLKAKTFYSSGMVPGGIKTSKAEARKKLGIDENKTMMLVMGGKGGEGTPYAPLTLAARCLPEYHIIVLGDVSEAWHATDSGNLQLVGWTDQSESYIAAADVVVASAGNNTVHEILRYGVPFICIPEWRYYDEQYCKATALHHAKAAIFVNRWPASPSCWHDVLVRAATLNPDTQMRLTDVYAGRSSAKYLLELADKCHVAS